MAAWLATLRNYGTAVADALLPPLCATCKEDVISQGALCARCWGNLNFVGPAHCQCCGVPFEVIDGADGLQCDMCMREPPAFARARAPLVYDDASRTMIMRLKHGDELHIVPSFVPFLRQAGAVLLARADALVPVPLHRWRLFKRRYNQSALMANALAASMNIAVLPEALVRTRPTPTQGARDRKERFKNVKGAFAVKNTEAVEGKTLVLIDDVLTTGATASECAKVLLAAGAARVDVLTLARVTLGR